MTLAWGEKDKCSMQEKCWQRRGDEGSVDGILGLICPVDLQSYI